MADIAKDRLPKPSLLPPVNTTPTPTPSEVSVKPPDFSKPGVVGTGPETVEMKPPDFSNPGVVKPTPETVEMKPPDFTKPGIAGEPAGWSGPKNIKNVADGIGTPGDWPGQAGGASPFGAPGAGATPAETEWQKLVRESNETLSGLMNLEDTRVQAAINRAITMSSLMNQAERDALQMQINQDPSLRGQGAGRALLQVMARDQGFSTDQMLATLSSENIDRIINLQKYGLEMGLKFNEIKYERDQANAKNLLALGNFGGAASAYNSIFQDQFPGLNINVSAADLKGRDPLTHDREQESLKNLLTTGQWDAAAALMNTLYPGSNVTAESLKNRDPQQYDRDQETLKNLLANGQWDAAAALMNKMNPGANVTAESLKGRDGQELTKMAQKLSFIKDLAKTNPNAALPLIASLLTDPQFKDYFPPGMTPEQILQSFVSGQVGEGIQQSKPIQDSINSLALAGQSFDETGKSYPELFRLMGRDAVKEGRKLSLEDANAIRQAEGLPAFSRDASGNLVDENGVLLDDEDFKELAYRADYAERVKTAKTKPWEAMKKSILESPMGKYFLDENLFPGGNAALDKFLMAYSLGADAFTRDPVTGEIVPNWDKLNLSVNSPEMWPIFHNWAAASFDKDGNVMKNPDGTMIYNQGGHVYGETVNGQKIMSTPDDEELDKAYFAYRNSGGKLGPQDWYLATAGGKMSPNESRIPPNLRTAPAGGALGTGENVGKGATDPDSINKIFEDVRAGKALTKEQTDALIKSGKIKEYQAGGVHGQDVNTLANENAGLITIGGKIVRVLSETSSKGRLKFVTVLINGKKYKLESNGDFFAYDADFNDVNIHPVDPWGGPVSGVIAGAGAAGAIGAGGG